MGKNAIPDAGSWSRNWPTSKSAASSSSAGGSLRRHHLARLQFLRPLLTRIWAYPDALVGDGAQPDDELQRLPADFRLDACHVLKVPGCQGQRHLLILRRTS